MVCAPSQTLTVDGRGWARCAHWERGCNWLTADDSASGRCFADSFVREGPAPDDTEAMAELDSTLKALRRLIFELMDLGLPVHPYYADPHGLAFDLLSSKTLKRPVVTGHANGVITIDLAESLELYRERLRIKLREPYRTMLGHFRHEVGHYYEMLLVQNTPLIDDTRAMFGDDREDYQAALQRHYHGERAGELAARLHLGVRHRPPVGRLRRNLGPLSAHHRNPCHDRGFGPCRRS